MKLLLLFSVVTYVTAQGRDKCAWGPSYWCSSVSQAKECGAVDHCMSTVWKHQILKSDNSDECMYCQFAFNELKEVLQNKNIQDDIAKYVADVCNLFPDADWKKTCNGIVKEDLPILIEMLDNKIQSQMICASFGMCSGLEDKYSPYGELAKTESDVNSPNSSCGDCTKFFKDVQESVTSNETLSELKQIINQLVCNRIPSLTSLCKDAVGAALPEFLKFLADQIDPDITCRVFGFCASTVKIDVIPVKNIFKNLKKPLEYRSGEECEACKDLLQEVVNFLRDNNTQQVVMSTIENYVCNNLGALGAQCKSLVEEYLPMLFELLVNELDPKTVCESVGLCKVPTGSLKLQALPIVKEEPAPLIRDGDRDNSIGCTVCQFAMQEVENILKRSGTIKTIDDLLIKVCDQFTSADWKQQCKSFVQEYGEMVIKDLASFIRPNMICSTIGLCASKQIKGVPNGSLKLQALPIVKEKPAPLISNEDPNNSIQCTVCQFAMQEVDIFLSKNGTIKYIKDLLDTVCDKLPSTDLKQQCESFVKEYEGMVIKDLEQFLDPKSFCSKMGLCASKQIKDVKEGVKTGVNGDARCDLCVIGVTELKTLIANMSTYYHNFQIEPPADLTHRRFTFIGVKTRGFCQESESLVVNTAKAADVFRCNIKQSIVGLAKEICNFLPLNISLTCAKYIDEYLAVAIDLLREEQPKALCQLGGLCTSSLARKPYLTKPIPEDIEAVDHETKSGNEIQAEDMMERPYCKQCRMGLTAIEKYCTPDCRPSQLYAALNRMCKLAPVDEKQMCNQMNRQHNTQIVLAIMKRKAPMLICLEIGICGRMLESTLSQESGIISPVDTLPILTENKKEKSTVPEIKSGNEILPENGNEILPENGNEIPPENGNEMGPYCQQCMMGLSFIEKDCEAGCSMSQLYKALVYMCDRAPKDEKLMCTEMTRRHGKAIVSALMKKEPPTVICQTIGICGRMLESTLSQESGIISPVDTLPIVSEENKKEVSAVDVSKNENGNEIPPENGNEMGAFCQQCQMGMNFIVSGCARGCTKSQIYSALNNMCGMAGPAEKQTCFNTIKRYGGTIARAVLKHESPNRICHKIGMCSGMLQSTLIQDSGIISPMDTLPILSEENTKEKSADEESGNEIQPENGNEMGPFCQQCRMGMDYVATICKRGCNEKKAYSALKSMCNMAPASQKQACNDLVKRKGKLLVSAIMRKEQPNLICLKIGACFSLLESSLTQESGIISPVDTLPIVSEENTKVQRTSTSLDVNEKASELCEACYITLLFVREFIDIMGNKTTEAETEEFLNIVCIYVPSTLKDKCGEFIKTVGPAIIQNLVKDFVPYTVCKDIELCDATPDRNLKLQTEILSLARTLPAGGLKVQQVSTTQNGNVKASELCEACNTVLLLVKEFIGNNATEAQIEQYLDVVCTYVPSALKSQCDEFIKEKGSDIIKYLVKDFDPYTVCKEIKLCNSKLAKNPQLLTAVISLVRTLPSVSAGGRNVERIPMTQNGNVKVSELCEACNTALLFIKEFIENNATEAQIDDYLDLVCDYIPSSLKAECDDVVKTYGLNIIKNLVKELDPYSVCKAIGLCNATLARNPKLQTAIKAFEIELPSAVKAECDDVVKMYGLNILKNLVKELDPYSVCKAIGLCNATFARNTKLQTAIKVKGTVDCDVCKLVASTADEALQQKTTQIAIKDGLLDVCKKLPTVTHSDCALLVNKFYMVAINYVLLAFSPDSICTELSFCPAVIDKVVPQNVEADIKCVVCEFVLKEVDNILQGNKSEAEIKKALDTVCSLLPDTISKECEDFVNKYEKQLINLLVKIDPGQVCTTLGLCTSNSLSSLATMVKILPEEKNKVGIDLCLPCKLVVTEVKNYLKENATTQDIINYFVGLCNILPDTVTAQCEDEVKQYIPAILDLIEQDLTPDQICQQIGFCNATETVKLMKLLKPSKAMPQKVDNTLYFKHHVHVLGKEKCTYGPAFWCANEDNAKMCGTVEHCRNHVWN